MISEQAQRDSREKHNDTETELRDALKEELSPRKQKVQVETRDIDYVSSNFFRFKKIKAWVKTAFLYF